MFIGYRFGFAVCLVFILMQLSTVGRALAEDKGDSEAGFGFEKAVELSASAVEKIEEIKPSSTKFFGGLAKTLTRRVLPAAKFAEKHAKADTGQISRREANWGATASVTASYAVDVFGGAGCAGVTLVTEGLGTYPCIGLVIWGSDAAGNYFDKLASEMARDVDEAHKRRSNAAKNPPPLLGGADSAQENNRCLFAVIRDPVRQASCFGSAKKPSRLPAARDPLIDNRASVENCRMVTSEEYHALGGTGVPMLNLSTGKTLFCGAPPVQAVEACDPNGGGVCMQDVSAFPDDPAPTTPRKTKPKRAPVSETPPPNGSYCAENPNDILCRKRAKGHTIGGDCDGMSLENDCMLSDEGRGVEKRIGGKGRKSKIGRYRLYEDN